MAMTGADQVITVSSYHAKKLIQDGLPPERVSIIRNGVDLDLFTYEPMREWPEFIFAYAGEFQSYQGMDNLIAAFERVPGPRLRLLVVGFTPEYADLKERFAERLGPRVTLVDRTDRKTLVSLLRRAAILVIPGIDHPGRRNVFPTKFAEYAALGRPVLVTDVDDTAVFVKEYGCGFVSGCSPELIAAAMETAAGSPLEELVRMGQAARAMAEEHFSWERIGDQYADLVHMVVERYRSQRRRLRWSQR
jgi:glycosyltransferase involved in cell wall biosynthesis